MVEKSDFSRNSVFLMSALFILILSIGLQLNENICWPFFLTNICKPKSAQQKFNLLNWKQINPLGELRIGHIYKDFFMNANALIMFFFFFSFEKVAY